MRFPKQSDKFKISLGIMDKIIHVFLYHYNNIMYS